MCKVYQIPMLFGESSEFGQGSSFGTFIVMIYEKMVKKRQAKAPEKDLRVKNIASMRKNGKKRHAWSHLAIRESKMRRFCNFWLILFNVRSLKPFA